MGAFEEAGFSDNTNAKTFLTAAITVMQAILPVKVVLNDFVQLSCECFDESVK